MLSNDIVTSAWHLYPGFHPFFGYNTQQQSKQDLKEIFEGLYKGFKMFDSEAFRTSFEGVLKAR